jgi:hypothetical protein
MKQTAIQEMINEFNKELEYQMENNKENKMRQTAIQELIQEFNKELEVSTQIGNEDKIRIIKHLINIATRYLPNEKRNIKDAFEEGDWNWRESQDITSEDYYNINFKSE